MIHLHVTFRPGRLVDGRDHVLAEGPPHGLDDILHIIVMLVIAIVIITNNDNNSSNDSNNGNTNNRNDSNRLDDVLHDGVGRASGARMSYHARRRATRICGKTQVLRLRKLVTTYPTQPYETHSGLKIRTLHIFVELLVYTFLKHMFMCAYTRAHTRTAKHVYVGTCMSAFLIHE